MNGRLHMAAGALAGAATAAVALRGGWVDTVYDAAVLGALCAAFAAFPDLDTASHPQRWAARALAAAVAALAWSGDWRGAALLGFAALLPLLTHHRGWTHRWWAVPLVPLGALLLWRALGERGGWTLPALDPAAWARGVAESVEPHLAAYIAMMGGYALHLVLDRVTFPKRRGR